jgi:hypothetical protein
METNTLKRLNSLIDKLIDYDISKSEYAEYQELWKDVFRDKSLDVISIEKLKTNFFGKPPI